MKLSKSHLLPLFLIISYSTHGQTWVNISSPGFSAEKAFRTSIALDPGGTPYVIYNDEGGKSTVMKFGGALWVTVGSAGFFEGTVSPGSIAIDSAGTPYVAYSDDLNGNKATVMKYDGISWVNVGIAGFSTASATFTSISIDRKGTPYVVFADNAAGSKATVMKYDGTGWVTVGVAGFSAGIAAYTSIAIDKSNTPYVVYQDFGDSAKAMVMKYSGGNWVAVGSAGFSAGEADFTSIAVDTSGTPYVVYRDRANGVRATVMKYNGTIWETVGDAGISADSVYDSVSNPMIAVNGGGTPYLLFECPINKGFLMTFNGGRWIHLCTTGLADAPAEYSSVAVDNSGTPYVAYQDWNEAGKATVMKMVASTTALKGLTNANATRIVIFPNPVTTLLTINSEENIDKITVSNVMGQTIYSNSYHDNEVQIDVSVLPAGIYLVRINDTEVRRFVKE